MNDDDLTTDLGRALRDHSDAMHGTSLALADVQHKARSIRRRRAATAVGGAVAAIALIVPTAALANHTGRSIEPLPATQSVTPTPSPTTSEGRQPPTGVLDVSDLPTGAAPATDYVYQGRLHLTDGSTGEVNTRYSPRDFVELADGARVWQTTDQGTPYIEIQDFDGSFHDPVRSGSEPQRQPASQHRGLADPGRSGHDLGGLGERAPATGLPGPGHRPAPGPDHGQRYGAARPTRSGLPAVPVRGDGQHHRRHPPAVEGLRRLLGAAARRRLRCHQRRERSGTDDRAHRDPRHQHLLAAPGRRRGRGLQDLHEPARVVLPRREADRGAAGLLRRRRSRRVRDDRAGRNHPVRPAGPRRRRKRRWPTTMPSGKTPPTSSCRSTRRAAGRWSGSPPTGRWSTPCPRPRART